MSYPDIKDKDFYKKINNKFKKYTIPNEKKTMKQVCFPKKFAHQYPQQFVANYINPNTPYKGLLVFHSIGAGKTCAAVHIAEQWIGIRHSIVVVPAALKGNFKNELRSKCANNYYLKDSERTKLKKLHPSSKEYKEIINTSDNRIDEYYTIYSYNKFIELANSNKIDLNNKLLIIDEIQNMVSEHGTYYQTLYDIINNKPPPNLRTILLSATPIFDKPVEIALTMNLLRIPKELPIGKEFNKMFLKEHTKKGLVYYESQNMDIFKKRIKGYVSYFRGAPPHVYPAKEIKYVKCEMSDFQYKSYITVNKKENKNKMNRQFQTFTDGDILKMPTNFFLGTRYISNIAFPNKNSGEKGYNSLDKKAIKLKNLRNYSIKFYKILKRISRCSGTIFVYSNFKEYGGIKSFIKVLEGHGFTNYTNSGEGRKRFAVWSGDEKIQMKEEIKSVFNQKTNADGSKIKILLGSPSIKEGVSLLRVQQVHIMEPYWNISRLEQVIGRAIRYCSHKDMPIDKRTVQVYIYLAVHKNEPESVDQYIQKLAHYKNNLIKGFELALKESAVDCTTNKHANVFKGEENIKCEK
jgi:superfamily II DNA or RNA helicase